MSDISKYKKLLSGSTTMPYGTSGGPSLLTGGHLRPSGHSHGAGCGCGSHQGDAHEDDDEQ